MATEKTARAIWEGDLMSGSGRVSTDSGVLSDEARHVVRSRRGQPRA